MRASTVELLYLTSKHLVLQRCQLNQFLGMKTNNKQAHTHTLTSKHTVVTKRQQHTPPGSNFAK